MLRRKLRYLLPILTLADVGLAQEGSSIILGTAADPADNPTTGSLGLAVLTWSFSYALPCRLVYGHAAAAHYCHDC